MSTAQGDEESNQIQGLIRSILLPAILAVATLVAGTSGYFLYLPTLTAYRDAPTLQLLGEGFFRSLGFLVLSMGTINSAESLALILLSVGRAAGFLFFFYAALTGVGLVFAKQLQPLRIDAWSAFGHLPGVDERGHVIVCGIGDNGYALATEALKAGRNVVVIDTDRTDRTAGLKEKGAIVFEGDATHTELLAGRARLQQAADVFVTTGSDSTNGAIVETIDRAATGDSWSQVIDVTACIEDRRLRRTLHAETKDTDGIHLQTYDVSEATARELLATTPIDDIDDPNQRIHIWIVGWTQLTKALVSQVLHLMHYPEGIDRKVTIITGGPTEAEQEIMALSPGIDPEWWDEPTMSEFVNVLFPEIDIRPLPASDMELLSDKTSLKETFQHQDKLTIIADDIDERSLRALISTWSPKLDEFAKEFELEAQLTYRSPTDANWTPSLSNIETTTYAAFGNGCSISSVRGEQRDWVARQLALMYHLQYAKNPEAVLPKQVSVPTGKQRDFDGTIEWLLSLSPEKREQYATAVWYDLPEYQRESNRYAADHAATKHRMAAVFEDVDSMSDQQVVRLLAESEHRRWGAEKILGGWESLPKEQKERWETERGEQMLRDQRYHPDIRPVDALRAEMNGEWSKDVTQVKSILRHPELINYHKRR